MLHVALNKGCSVRGCLTRGVFGKSIYFLFTSWNNPTTLRNYLQVLQSGQTLSHLEDMDFIRSNVQGLHYLLLKSLS